jgi:hypothetical protein
MYDMGNSLKRSYDYRPIGDGQLVLLNVESRAHIVHAFVNNQHVGQYPMRTVGFLSFF